MSIEVELGSEGLEEAEALIQQLSKIASNAWVVAESRTESGKTNADVLEYLAEIGKDYVTTNNAEKAAIAKEYVKVFDGEIQKALDAKHKLTDSDRKKIEKAALTAAMKVRQKQVADKVKAGGSVRTGQLLRNLENIRNIRVK